MMMYWHGEVIDGIPEHKAIGKVAMKGKRQKKDKEQTEQQEE